jgi:hypothetical protein
MVLRVTLVGNEEDIHHDAVEGRSDPLLGGTRRKDKNANGDGLTETGMTGEVDVRQ